MFQVDGILTACLPDLCDLVVRAMTARGWRVRNLGRLPSVEIVSDLDYSGSYYDGRIKVNDDHAWHHCVDTLVHELTHHFDGVPVDMAAVRHSNSIPDGDKTDADWEEYRNFPWEIKARAIAEELREAACVIAARKRLEQIRHKTGRHYRAEKTALLNHLRYHGEDRKKGESFWDRISRRAGL